MEGRVTVQNGANAVKNNALEWPNVTLIINAVVDVCLRKKSKEQAVKEILTEYKDVAVLHIEIRARQMIDDMIRSAPEKGVQELSQKEFADRTVGSVKAVAASVYRFCRKEITLQQFVDSLCDTDLKKIVNDTLEALGVPEALGQEDAESIWRMSSDQMAYAAFTEVYKELRQALVDAHMAYERRLEIEAECAESVACITRYRTQMEQIASEYLRVRYETFETGFAAMDRAIMENDIHGYLRGNAEIQKVLGYNSQFTTMEEFDDLMLSDEDFKL